MGTHNPHLVTKQLEQALCEYTGAPYCVAVNSCTMALELAFLWQRRLPLERVKVPRRTYVSVPQAIVRAGFEIEYVDIEWKGAYQLFPYPIWDCAKRLTSWMYRPRQFMCVSFHVAKTLGDTQGGAILHDCEDADRFFRLARYDGREEGVPLLEHKKILPDELTRHCYLSPDVSVRILNHMQYLPRVNSDQEETYPVLG